MKKTLEERFWDKVDITGACWNWTGSTTGVGYGHLKVEGKDVAAHRFAYSLIYGIIPDGLCICHHCDNKACVKPSHLFLGTYSDNQQDSVTKGRKNSPQGEASGMSKLVENDVHEIRRLHERGVNQTILGKMWGISGQHIGRIVNRKRWRHT